MKNDQRGAARLKAVLLVVGFLICALVIGKLISSAQNGYKATGNKFVDTVAKEDAETSYAMMTPRLQKTVGSEQAWQAQVSKSFDGQKAQIKLVSSKPVQNPAATYGRGAMPQHLVYSFVFSTGKHYQMDVVLLQSSGTWKVDEFMSELQ